MHLDRDRGVEMAFRRIPAGRFRMGQRGEYADEEPVHWVEIPHDFWMAETPVTQEQFAVWKPEHEIHFAERPKDPAENMTWHDAVEYCEWLTQQCPEEIPVVMVVRLPWKRSGSMRAGRGRGVITPPEMGTPQWTRPDGMQQTRVARRVQRVRRSSIGNAVAEVSQQAAEMIAQGLRHLGDRSQAAAPGFLQPLLEEALGLGDTGLAPEIHEADAMIVGACGLQVGQRHQIAERIEALRIEFARIKSHT